MRLADRIQAIARLSRYREDYEKYEEAAHRGTKDALGIYDAFVHSGPYPHIRPLSKAAQKLCQKWKIPFPVNPDVVLNPRSSKFVENFGSGKPFYYKFPSVIPVSRLQKDGSCVIGPDRDFYLTVRIDMSQPFQQIRNDLKPLYDDCKRLGKNKDRRNRDSLTGRTYTIWTVYDLKEKDGLTLDEIAKKLGKRSGVLHRKVPSEICGSQASKQAKQDIALLQEIKTAYSKAKRLIKEAERK